MIAVVKDILIYVTIIAAVIIIPAQLGGYAKIFAAVPPENYCCKHLPQTILANTAPTSLPRSAPRSRCFSIRTR